MSRVSDKPNRITVAPTDSAYLFTPGKDYQSTFENILEDLGIPTLGLDGKLPLSVLPDVIVSGGGNGDVLGPSTSIDGRPALFDGTSGKGIKQGVAGQLVPPGGAAGRPLVKASGTDFDTTWGSALGDVVGPASVVSGRVALFGSTSGKAIIAGEAGQIVPPGGTTGQVLGKTSNGDYATGWITVASGGSGDVTGPASSVDSAPALFNGTGGKTIKQGVAGQLVPAGGSTAQALVKSSVTDYATTWAAVGDVVGPASVTSGLPAIYNGTTGKLLGAGLAGQFVPPGGTSGQALIKSSNSDYAVEWGDVEGVGGSVAWDDITGDAAAGRAVLELDNVDNTSDLNKPISTAVQDGLDAREPLVEFVTDATDARTLSLADDRRYVSFTSATGATLTIPPLADVAFPAGFVSYGEPINFQMEIVGGDGVTLVSLNDDVSDGAMTVPLGVPYVIRRDPGATDTWRIYAGAGASSGGGGADYLDSTVSADPAAANNKIAAFNANGQLKVAPLAPVPLSVPTKSQAVAGTPGLFRIDPELFVRMYEPVSVGALTATLDVAPGFTIMGTVGASLEFTGITGALNGLSYSIIIRSTADDVDLTFSDPPFQLSSNIVGGTITLDTGEVVRLSISRAFDDDVSFVLVNATQYLAPTDEAPAFSAPSISPAVGASGNTFTIVDSGLTGSPTPTITAEGGWTINGEEATASTSKDRTQTVKGRLRAKTVTATNGVGSPAVWPSDLVASVGPVQPIHIGHSSVINDTTSGGPTLTLPLSGVSGLLDGDDVLLVYNWTTSSTVGEVFPAGFTKIGTTIAHTSTTYPGLYRVFMATGKVTTAQIASGLSVKMANASSVMAICARGVAAWDVDNTTITQSATNTVAFTRRTLAEPSLAYQIVAGARDANIRDIAASSGWSTPVSTPAFTIVATQGINFSWREVPDGLTPAGSNVGASASSSHLTSILVGARGPL